MSLIKSEVDKRFAKVKLIRPNKDPVTGDVWLSGLVPEDDLKRIDRRALLAQEYFSEYGPRDAPALPLNGREIERLKRRGDLPLAVARYAGSLQANGWDFKVHPGFEEYVGGLLALSDTEALAKPYFKHPEELLGRFRPYPLRGLWATGMWWPPVH